ncbi:MAG: NADH-quinone oxidoreductase subunit K [Candidatus Geothermincolia bacterium]
MSRAVSFLGLAVAMALLFAGMFMVATERNLLRKLMGTNLAAAGAVSLAILAGFVRNATVLGDGTRAAANQVSPVMQWLAIVGVVAVTAITAVGIILALNHARQFKTLDLEEKRNRAKDWEEVE